MEGRDNIVMTRNPDFAEAGIRSVPTLEAALELAAALARQRGVDEIMVIDGRSDLQTFGITTKSITGREVSMQ